MIHAYDNQYLDDAMKCLGEAMDYAANGCQINMDEFLNLFIGTGYAEQFAAGVPKYVSGVSGTELVMDVLTKSGTDMDFPQAQIDYDYSPQYWCGWILAYYQWYTGRSFKEIQKHITMQEIEKLYPTLHEASEKKFVDTVNRMIRKRTRRPACRHSANQWLFAERACRKGWCQSADSAAVRNPCQGHQ